MHARSRYIPNQDVWRHFVKTEPMACCMIYWHLVPSFLAGPVKHLPSLHTLASWHASGASHVTVAHTCSQLFSIYFHQL